MYGSFYSNICKFLSALNGGIKHQRPRVNLPLTKVGLELGQILTNLGIINDCRVSQRMNRLRKYSKKWDPIRTHLTSSAAAAAYPAMYLTLDINWDKHRPLWSTLPLPAQEYVAAPLTQQSRSTQKARASWSSHAPDMDLFTPPVGINAPTPESIKIISRPSAQRVMGVRQLVAARKQVPPGIFLLSTSQGLLTDIDCELRGVGGTVLAHLGLPLAHVAQLRGLLRAKFQQEVSAALGHDGASAPLTPHVVKAAKLLAQHEPLAKWSARAASAQGINARLQAAAQEAGQLLEIMAGDVQADDELEQQAQEVLVELAVQESVWRHHHQQEAEGEAEEGDWEEGEEEDEDEQEADMPGSHSSRGGA